MAAGSDCGATVLRRGLRDEVSVVAPQFRVYDDGNEEGLPKHRSDAGMGRVGNGLPEYRPGSKPVG